MGSDVNNIIMAESNDLKTRKGFCEHFSLAIACSSDFYTKFFSVSVTVFFLYETLGTDFNNRFWINYFP